MVQIIYRSVRTGISLFLLCCIILVTLGRSCYAEPHEVQLTADERNRLDTFFSNFSGRTFDPFSYGAISDNNLTRFGLNYLARNKYGNKFFVKISVKELDKVTTLYFDRVAKKHRAIYGWNLDNGFYHKILFADEKIPSLIDESWDNDDTFAAILSFYSQMNGWRNDSHGLADEEIPSFSQIDELWDNGDGTFTAIISVYSQTGGWKGDPHGIMEEWAKNDPQHCPQLKGKYRAIISLDYIGDSERYILQEYLLNLEPANSEN